LAGLVALLLAVLLGLLVDLPLAESSISLLLLLTVVADANNMLKTILFIFGIAILIGLVIGFAMFLLNSVFGVRVNGLLIGVIAGAIIGAIAGKLLKNKIQKQS
jgi:membrane associated rhomboid family serine protease